VSKISLIFRVSQLIKIGKLTRVHGLKGALVVSGDNLQGIEIKKSGFLFIEINNIPTPFFVSDSRYIGKNLVLGFDGIKTIEEAKLLIGKELWADEKNISIKKTTTTSLEGYDLIDDIKGNVGKINELIVLPKQQFLSVQINNEEALLPYTDAFVRKIDHKTKTVYYCAPDGLFDIN
jgi:16S rRNA processing protein RimM